jgi:ParB/RepB/Spo0J family partition protein
LQEAWVSSTQQNISGEAAMIAGILRLAAEGRGDDAIARQLGCTRHRARVVRLQNAVAPRVGAGQIREISVGQVHVSDGRRGAARDKVRAIAESISASGLINPITVRELRDGATFVLMAGRHRLEAFRHLDRNSIPAFVMPSSTTNDEARMVEISENIHRAELTVQEKADLTAEWITLRGSKAGKTGQVSKGGRGHEGGVADAARELDMPRTTVRRAIQIASITAEGQGSGQGETDRRQPVPAPEGGGRGAGAPGRDGPQAFGRPRHHGVPRRA